jgi:hypothetical protein
MADSDGTPDDSLTRETDERLAQIHSRFPNRFDEAQIGEIRARIVRSINLGRSLRKAELSNGEGPDLVVTALPPRTETA